MIELIGFLFVTLIALFTVVNPLSTTSIFLSLTEGFSKQEKNDTAKEATITSLIIMLIFALSGFIIFEFFSFTLASFKIMGGLFLFSISWKMLKGEGKEIHKVHTKSEITLVPLAIPLISGPATIVTSVVLFHQASSIAHKGMVLLAIVLVLYSTFIILKNSQIILKILRDKGIRVMNKLMGLVLGSISVQFVINGISDVIPKIVASIN